MKMKKYYNFILESIKNWELLSLTEFSNLSLKNKASILMDIDYDYVKKISNENRFNYRKMKDIIKSNNIKYQEKLLVEYEKPNIINIISDSSIFADLLEIKKWFLYNYFDILEGEKLITQQTLFEFLTDDNKNKIVKILDIFNIDKNEQKIGIYFLVLNEMLIYTWFKNYANIINRMNNISRDLVKKNVENINNDFKYMTIELDELNINIKIDIEILPNDIKNISDVLKYNKDNFEKINTYKNIKLSNDESKEFNDYVSNELDNLYVDILNNKEDILNRITYKFYGDIYNMGGLFLDELKKYDEQKSYIFRNNDIEKNYKEFMFKYKDIIHPQIKEDGEKFIVIGDFNI